MKCTMYMQYRRKPEEGIRSLELELQMAVRRHVDAGIWILQKKHVLLASEPSLQLHCRFFHAQSIYHRIKLLVSKTIVSLMLLVLFH